MPAFRISQCRFLSKLVGANSHGKTFVVPVDPSGELGFATPSHSRTTPVPIECCPHFASGSCPWENYSAIDFLNAPRGAIRENVCVTDANGSTMKDRSLPELIFHCEV